MPRVASEIDLAALQANLQQTVCVPGKPLVPVMVEDVGEVIVQDRRIRDVAQSLIDIEEVTPGAEQAKGARRARDC